MSYVSSDIPPLPYRPSRPDRHEGSDLPLDLIGRAFTGQPERYVVRHDNLTRLKQGRGRERSKGVEISGQRFGPIRQALHHPAHVLRTAASVPHSLSHFFHHSHANERIAPHSVPHAPPTIASPSALARSKTQTSSPSSGASSSRSPNTPAARRITHGKVSTRTAIQRRRRHSLTGSALPSAATVEALRMMLGNEPLVPAESTRITSSREAEAQATAERATTVPSDLHQRSVVSGIKHARAHSMRRKPVPRLAAEEGTSWQEHQGEQALPNRNWTKGSSQNDRALTIDQARGSDGHGSAQKHSPASDHSHQVKQGAASARDAADKGSTYGQLQADQMSFARTSHTFSIFADAKDSAEAAAADGRVDDYLPSSSATSAEFSTMATYTMPPSSLAPGNAILHQSQEFLHDRQPSSFSASRSHRKEFSLSLDLPPPELDIDLGLATPDSELHTPAIGGSFHQRAPAKKGWLAWQSSADGSETRAATTKVGLGFGDISILGTKSGGKSRPQSSQTEAFELDDMTIRGSPSIRNEDLGQEEHIDVTERIAANWSWRNQSRHPASESTSGYWNLSLDLGNTPRASLSNILTTTARKQTTEATQPTSPYSAELREATLGTRLMGTIKRLSRAISPQPPVNAGLGGPHYHKRQVAHLGPIICSESAHEALHRAIFNSSDTDLDLNGGHQGATSDRTATVPANPKAIPDGTGGVGSSASSAGWSLPSPRYSNSSRPFSMTSGLSSLGLSDVEEMVAFSMSAPSGQQASSIVRSPHFYVFPSPPPSIKSMPHALSTDHPSKADTPKQTPSDSSPVSQKSAAARLAFGRAKCDSQSERSTIKPKRNRRDTFGVISSWISRRTETTATAGDASPGRWDTHDLPPLPALVLPDLPPRTASLRSSAAVDSMRPLPLTPAPSQKSLTSEHGLFALGLYPLPSVEALSDAASCARAEPEGHGLVEGAPLRQRSVGSQRGGSYRTGGDSAARRWTCGCWV